ncbi:hypothetical protein EDB85DRAFT_1900457 [Lactarius pseudohatsudake]|nr:hypothetical protein EDB85DRAFT_1900457 [Lactarius pseudohatsudake]
MELLSISHERAVVPTEYFALHAESQKIKRGRISRGEHRFVYNSNSSTNILLQGLAKDVADLGYVPDVRGHTKGHIPVVLERYGMVAKDHHSSLVGTKYKSKKFPKRTYKEKDTCIVRESNPGRVEWAKNGNDPGYHYPNNALMEFQGATSCTQVKDLAEVPAAQASPPLDCNTPFDKVTPVAHRSSQRQECKVQPLRMRFHWHVIHYEQAIKIRTERELSGTEMNQQVNEGGTHKESAIRTHTSTEGSKAVESPPILLFPQRHVGGVRDTRGM